MIRRLLDLIKRNPTSFDFVRRLQRLVGFRTPAICRVLDALSRSHDRSIFFLQIGASDGLRNDPIREFIVRDSWHGILVEPLPAVFDLLIANYRRLALHRSLSFVNCAITTEQVPFLTMWSFEGDSLKGLSAEERLDLLQKSSVDRCHLEQFLGSRPPGSIKAIHVPCLTFSALVEQHMPPGRQLDLLVLDVEGQEWNILKSINFSIFKPESILYESRHLGETCEPLRALLADNGYEVTSCGPDDFAHAKGL